MPMSAIRVLAIVNFVLAALAGIVILLLGVILVYGVVYSGDSRQEIAKGVVGSIVLAVPVVFACCVYTLAGFGLLRRRSWGYYLHIVGAVLAIFTCLGAVWTVVGLRVALRDDFKEEIFKLTDP